MQIMDFLLITFNNKPNCSNLLNKSLNFQQYNYFFFYMFYLININIVLFFIHFPFVK